MESFEHSCVLFVGKNGKPMQFCMAPCDERVKLRPIIEHGSGVLSSKSFVGSVRLVPHGLTANSENCVKSSYVMACVGQNKLLPLEKYSLQNGKKNFDELDDTTADIDVNSDESHVFSYSSKDRQGRNRYLLSEDNAILRFLLEEGRYSAASGNLVWKDMAMCKVTSHSWQSMKDRYRKHILSNILSYNLTQQEVASLKGILAHQVPNKPGNQNNVKRFMDAGSSSFPSPDKSTSLMSSDEACVKSPLGKQLRKTPRKKSGTAVDDGATSQVSPSGRKSNVHPNGELRSGSGGKVDGDKGADYDSDPDSLDMELLKQATLQEEDDDVSKSPPAKRTRTRNSSKMDAPNLISERPGLRNAVKNNDGDSNRARLRSSRDVVAACCTRSGTKDKEMSSPPSNSPQSGSPRRKKHKSQRNTPDKKRSIKTRLMKATEGHENMNSLYEENNDESDAEKGDGVDKINKSSEGRVRSRKTQSVTLPEVVGDASPDEKMDVVRQIPRKKRASDSQAPADMNSDDAREDGDEDKEGDVVNEEADEMGEASQSLLPQAEKNTPVRSPSSVSKKSRLRNFVMLDTQGSQDSEGFESLPVEQNMVEEARMDQLNETCQRVCDWLEVTPKQLLATLYAANGSMPDAISWLLGETRDVVHWDSELNSKLLEGNNDDYDEVVGKMTEEATRARCQFLFECAD